MKFSKQLMGSSISLLITFNLFNLVNFFFQFGMARLLTLENFGILATLTSLIYIFGIFSESIQTVVTKYASHESDTGKLKNLLTRSLKKSLFVSSFIFLVYLLLAWPFSSVLEINYYLLALNGIIIFSSFLLPVSRGILQGTKRFDALGKNMIIESVMKLAFGIGFVYLGLQVAGALFGIIIGFIFAFLFSFVDLKPFLAAREKRYSVPGIYAYTRPVFFVVIAFVAFFSLDIIIAKIVFDPTLAGAYAIASTLGKIIVLGTQPISKALFPLSAETVNRAQSRGLLNNSLVLLLAGIIAALLLFLLVPRHIIFIFTGEFIDSSIAILFPVGVAAGLMALSNLILFYKLSLGNIRGYFFLFVAVALEVTLLMLFSANLGEYSIAYIAASAILLISSVFFVRNEHRHSHPGLQRRKKN